MPELASPFLIIAILLGTIALPFTKAQVQRHLGTVLIVLCTLATVVFLHQIASGQAKAGKMQSQLSEEKAESALRMMSCLNVGLSKIYELGGPLQDKKGHRYTALEASRSGMGNYFKVAEESLKAAIKANPKDKILKAKLVVLLSVYGKHRDLLKSSCEELKASSDTSDRELGELLWEICVQQDPVSADNLPAQKALIEKRFARGWYQETALLALYKNSSSHKDHQTYSKQLEERYNNSFKTGAILFSVAAISAFIGVIVIIIQLGSLGRKEKTDVPEEDRIKLDLSLRTVYAVFVGWMSSELAIGEGFKLLANANVNFRALFGAGAIGLAELSFVSYMLTMIPALLLIHFVALRPKGLLPFSALKLRFKTPQAGPFSLVLKGFLSWCAIFPCVLIASVISFGLGLQGSDNPILPQIAIIAGSNDVLAIGLLITTVAVMAPLCEEIIFRGFLYSALRTKWGIFPAILVSSFVFAFIHFDKGGSLMLLALAPVLALAFERNRSLLPSMVAHGLWNGGSVAAMLTLFLN